MPAGASQRRDIALGAGTWRCCEAGASRLMGRPWQAVVARQPSGRKGVVRKRRVYGGGAKVPRGSGDETGPIRCVVPYPGIWGKRNHARRDPPRDPHGSVTSRASRDPSSAFVAPSPATAPALWTLTCHGKVKVDCPT